MKQLLIGWASMLVACCSVFGAEQPEQKLKFENNTGWVWHIEPTSLSPGSTMATRGMVMRLDELKGNRLLLTLVYAEQANQDIVQVKPVAFNSSGQRNEFTSAGGAGDGGALLSGFVFDMNELPLDQIKFVGIEKLTKDGLRDVVAPAAFQKLKGTGVNVLPFPQIGKLYEFELTAVDGKKICSTDLRGKVVLLDFYAKWCGPCMRKMPKLKETYQKFNSRGFEIIGLNHDRTLEEANATIVQEELPWPSAFAPADGGQRELWLAASGTGTLPRLLLIDRDGILRADISPHDLDAEIDKLMNKP
jgi:peroxiredoxin